MIALAPIDIEPLRRGATPVQGPSPGPKAARRAPARPSQTWQRLAFSLSFCVAALLPPAASAQVPPAMVMADAGVFEGPARTTRILSLPVRFFGAQANTVTGRVSATPLTGTGFNTPTGGFSCGAAGVDFVPFSNEPFSIPPNTPNGTLTVNITVCGDAATERDEHIFVALSDVVGADCFEGTCNGVATIRNDDGRPSLSINSITVSEPLFGTRTALFTVRASHPVGPNVAVNFRTRDGTARAPCLGCPPSLIAPDYYTKSGTLVIPQDALSATIGVTIGSGTDFEPNENFFVDLSAPANATLDVATGRGTIVDTTLSLGSFQLGQESEQVRVEEPLQLTLDWSVPPHQVWRNLRSIDLRLGGAKHHALWLRWDEASNQFSLCEKTPGGNDDEAHSNGLLQQATRCGPGALPGSSAVLETPFGRLHLASTEVKGSGPTGQDVRMTLGLSLTGRAAGHHYRIEAAARDDFGQADRFERAGNLTVLRR